MRRSTAIAGEKVVRFNRVGRQLSRNDVRVVLLSQLLVELNAGRKVNEVGPLLDELLPETRAIIEGIWRAQDLRGASDPVVPQPGPVQLELLGSVITGGTEV
jgi:hypothetical protein